MAQNVDAVHFLQHGAEGMGKGRFISGNVGKPQLLQIGESGAEGDGPGVVGRTCLPAVGGLFKGGVFLGHGVHHAAAIADRLKPLQPFGFAVKDADAGGGHDLVAGEAVEIAVDGLNICPFMPHTLRAVGQEGSTIGVGGFGHFG